MSLAEATRLPMATALCRIQAAASAATIGSSTGEPVRAPGRASPARTNCRRTSPGTAPAAAMARETAIRRHGSFPQRTRSRTKRGQ